MPWRIHTGVSFLAMSVACREPMLEQSLPGGLYSMEKTHIEQFVKNCSQGKGDSHTAAGKECEEEKVMEINYEPTATVNPRHSALPRGGRVRKKKYSSAKAEMK